MRYRAIFTAGLAVGFVVGARAGRERYDQLVGFCRKIAGHPTVQKTTRATAARATDLTKTAAAKAPDLAKTATAQVTAQVPKITAAASAAKRQAVSRIPFAGKGGGGPQAPHKEAADTADAQVPYQDDGSTAASYNGMPAELSARLRRAFGTPSSRRRPPPVPRDSLPGPDGAARPWPAGVTDWSPRG